MELRQHGIRQVPRVVVYDFAESRGGQQAGAEHVARRMLEAVGALGMPHHDSPTNPNVTVSVGIACYDESSACWVPASADHRLVEGLQVRPAANDLVRAADKALYAAKGPGGPRLSSETSPT